MKKRAIAVIPLSNSQLRWQVTLNQRFVSVTGQQQAQRVINRSIN